MIRITTNQFANVQEARRPMLERDLRRHLRKQHADLVRGLPAEVERARIRHAIRSGEELELKTIRSFAYLAALIFRFGPGVPRSADLRGALAGGDRDHRMAGLPGLLDDAAWHRLAADGQGWERAR